MNKYIEAHFKGVFLLEVRLRSWKGAEELYLKRIIDDNSSFFYVLKIRKDIESGFYKLSTTSLFIMS